LNDDRIAIRQIHLLETLLTIRIACCSHHFQGRRSIPVHKAQRGLEQSTLFWRPLVPIQFSHTHSSIQQLNTHTFMPI